MQNTISNQINVPQLRDGLALLALVSLIAIAANPAFAQPRHDDRDWHRHEVVAHRYWHGPHYVEEPGAVYAPPVVYEPPPVEQSPGLNLVIPIRIH